MSHAVDLPAHLTATERRRVQKALRRDGGRCVLCGGLAYRVVLWVHEDYADRDGRIYLLCWSCDRQDHKAALDALTERHEQQRIRGRLNHGLQNATTR